MIGATISGSWGLVTNAAALLVGTVNGAARINQSLLQPKLVGCRLNGSLSLLQERGFAPAVPCPDGMFSNESEGHLELSTALILIERSNSTQN